MPPAGVDNILPMLWILLKVFLKGYPAGSYL